jgi:pimeloyl-ACP methyl ester carboxylesterase
MLPYRIHPSRSSGLDETTLVMMPFLGGGQREWTEVIGLLGGRFRCITIDLPGFGDAANIKGYSVEEMRAAVIDTLATLELNRYALVGHSMAGKVSAVVARSLAEDASRVHPPASLVLVAPSPPGPEPMTESKRDRMRESLGIADPDPREDRKNAEKFIRDNIASELPASIFDRTVDDVVRMNRAAWNAWLDSGSKEDWSARVGVLDIPTLIVAGEEDKALGPKAQQESSAPYFSNLRLEALESSHLIPLEQPAELAALIRQFIG